jgi:isopentenyl diphosphate isomerase/L-lactate dehydrogenase-like FMN-dependent dehydrogenase
MPYFMKLWHHSIGGVFLPYMPNLSRASGLERAPTALEVIFSKDITKTIRGTNDSTLRWEDLAWLKQKIRGRVPLIGKGILDPRDAISAVEAGADAIVVSNHGGRQCDGAICAVDALPKVIDALKQKHPQVKVFCDTGVRTSVDVLRIMALGGAGALIGRPPLYALMCGGSEALEKMLVQWRYDIREDMKCFGWERWDVKPEGLIAPTS